MPDYNDWLNNYYDDGIYDDPGMIPPDMYNAMYIEMWRGTFDYIESIITTED